MLKEVENSKIYVDVFSIVGWQSVVGAWTRVEGTPTELDPDRSHATTDNFYLFDDSGKLLPSKFTSTSKQKER